MSVFQNIKSGIPAKQTAEPQDKPGGETDLQKLRRVDLLELLLEQIRKNEIQTAELEEATDLGERLKVKLDDKDAQLERLKVKLNQKDAKIDLLQDRLHELAKETGTLTAHDLELEELAVDHYLQHAATQTTDEPAVENPWGKRNSISLPDV